MLSDVVSAVSSSKKVIHLIVVTSDREIEHIIPKNTTLLLEDRPRGINQAIIEATEYSTRMNAEATLVIPADLPLIKTQDIDTIISKGKSKPAVILSSSLTGGTNILYRAPPKIIEPKFGINSFQAHLEESRKMNVEPKIYSSPRVSLDLDEIEDIKKFIQYGNHTKTFEVLHKTELIFSRPKK
jgi:2-phospho-L-lactate guanylyltransferase